MPSSEEAQNIFCKKGVGIRATEMYRRIYRHKTCCAGIHNGKREKLKNAWRWEWKSCFVVFFLGKFCAQPLLGTTHLYKVPEGHVPCVSTGQL